MSVHTIQQLVDAANRHDLEAMAACFAPDFRNETPVHPDRGFVGRDQVRQNWSQIFRAVPDIQIAVLRSASAGDTLWTEWEFTGTRLDGRRHLMRGVTIWGAQHDRLTWVRFYMEPVEADGVRIDEAVRAHLTGEGA